MKQLSTIILIALSINGFAQAPPIQWQKTYGGSFTDVATAIRQTVDGGYIVVGFTNSDDSDVTNFPGGANEAGTSNTEIWVVRLNGAGDMKWNECLGSGGISTGIDVQQTADGGYAVGGYEDGAISGFRYYLYKLDSSGTVKWTKNYGGSYADELTSLALTNDGGYLLAGTSRSVDGDVTGHHGVYSNGDYWVVKLDDTGSIQWEKSLGGSYFEICGSACQTKDGGYIVAGCSLSNDGDVTGHHGDTCNFVGYCGDYWVARLDRGGNVVWEQSYGGTDDDEATYVQQTTDGGYIVFGATNSSDGQVTGHNKGPVTSTPDYWLIKLDSSGTLLWQKDYGGTFNEVAHTVQQTADGGFIMAGTSNSVNGDVTGNIGNYDYWIVKTDDNGNLQWKQNYGGSSYDEAYCAQQTADGGFIIAGVAASQDSEITRRHLTGENIWIIKLAGSASGVKDISGRNDFTLYPNPASEQLTISSGQLIKGEIEITDLLGRPLLTQNVSSGQTTIDVSGLSTGVYLARLKNKEGSVSVKRFVKE